MKGSGRIVLLLITLETSLLGRGGGPLLHPDALFLKHSTPVHPLPLHGGQILTREGRVTDEKVAWLLPLLDPSQVPCRSVAPQPSSCWYPSLQSKEHPLLLPHLTAGPFDYGFFLQSNSSAFSFFRNSSEMSCPWRALSAVIGFFFNMYLKSFLDARDKDVGGETKECQPSLGRYSVIPLTLWTAWKQNSHLIHLSFSHNAYQSTVHRAGS